MEIEIMDNNQTYNENSEEYLASNSVIRDIERRMKEGYAATEEFKDIIYEIMNGSYDMENSTIPETMIIKDEFEEGSFCAQAYEDIYQAKQRLYERLDVESDQDIELIIYKMQNISRHMCMKMYDYGKFFSYLAQK